MHDNEVKNKKFSNDSKPEIEKLNSNITKCISHNDIKQNDGTKKCNSDEFCKQNCSIKYLNLDLKDNYSNRNETKQVYTYLLLNKISDKRIISMYIYIQ